MKTQPLSDFPSNLYRASGRDWTDSETEYSTESDEMDSDSGYDIGGCRRSCHCVARHASPVAERTELPVYVDDCTSVPLSPTDRLVLVPHQWPSTAVTCSYNSAMCEVIDTRHRADCASTATSMQLPRRDDSHTANIGVNTGCQQIQTAQSTDGGVSLHSIHSQHDFS